MGIYLPGEKLTADRLNERTLDVLGGQYRTTQLNTITAETVIATASNIPLRASTTYTVELHVSWGNTVSGEQFYFRVRDTNIAGTLRADDIREGKGGGPYDVFCIYPFVTTTATTRTFVATMTRLVGSSGSGGVNANTRLRVVRDGDSGIYTTV